MRKKGIKHLKWWEKAKNIEKGLKKGDKTSEMVEKGKKHRKRWEKGKTSILVEKGGKTSEMMGNWKNI